MDPQLIALRFRGQRIKIQGPPFFPITTKPDCLEALQFLQKNDFLRHPLRKDFLCLLTCLEFEVVRYLIATGRRPTPQTSEEPKPSSKEQPHD